MTSKAMAYCVDHTLKWYSRGVIGGALQAFYSAHLSLNHLSDNIRGIVHCKPGDRIVWRDVLWEGDVAIPIWQFYQLKCVPGR